MNQTLRSQFVLLTVSLTLILSSCARPQATAGMIHVLINVDDSVEAIEVASGASVQQALDSAGVILGSLDRADPPGYTVLSDGAEIDITRVLENFEIEEIIIPFDRQTVRNEALPEGETRLLQPGQNGLQELTYRILIEADIEVSRAPVKNVIITEPVPEIIMIGTQSTHSPVTIDGSLVYITGGNAWVIEGSSGSRRPLIVTGDLDGRIIKISPDGQWLLFTRETPEEEETINGLWVASMNDSEFEMIDLGVRNIIHFADWVPEKPSFTVTYSTSELSPASPGWQANNDLMTITFTSAGRPLRPRIVIEANAGGQYGWWGTNYVWGYDNDHLAYVRADSYGLVDLEKKELVPLQEIIPFQTLGDWAWVPGLVWGRDNQTIYFVAHDKPLGLESPQASPAFNIEALTMENLLKLTLANRTGMFAYPTVSQILSSNTAEISYRVAFLQAITPLESQESTYRLAVMDRDGSNLRYLFPPTGDPGLEPYLPGPIWSPGGDRIAIIHKGNLWIVEVETGTGQQLTADGQTQIMDWAP